MIELRWLRLNSPPFDRILQFREISKDGDNFPYYGKWQDVPLVDETS